MERGGQQKVHQLILVGGNLNGNQIPRWQWHDEQSSSGGGRWPPLSLWFNKQPPPPGPQDKRALRRGRAACIHMYMRWNPTLGQIWFSWSTLNVLLTAQDGNLPDPRSAKRTSAGYRSNLKQHTAHKKLSKLHLTQPYPAPIKTADWWLEDVDRQDGGITPINKQRVYGHVWGRARDVQAVFRHLDWLQRCQRSLKLKLKFSLETLILIRWFAELYFSSAGETAAVGNRPASTWRIFIC